MKHLKYLRYIVVHKWFVMLACFRYGLYWQGIIHDWSKFLPSEWLPYAEFFYGEARPQKDTPGTWTKAHAREPFNVAWLKHQHRCPHHYQHWILRNDDGTTVPLQMPHRYLFEMLADWEGAGRAITGKHGGTPAWYAKNRDKMLMHQNTRVIVDLTLGFVPQP